MTTKDCDTEGDVMVYVGRMYICEECQNKGEGGGFCTIVPKSSKDLPKCDRGFVAKWKPMW